MFASRSPAKHWPHVLQSQDHFYITPYKVFRFRNNKFNEMPCKLDSTENPRSFQKYPTPTAKLKTHPFLCCGYCSPLLQWDYNGCTVTKVLKALGIVAP